jgi:hypothetical protein
MLVLVLMSYAYVGLLCLAQQLRSLVSSAAVDR